MSTLQQATRLRRPGDILSAVQRRARSIAGAPPAVPRGWEPGPPTFVGVGTQRSGTKWWYRMICDHPDVHPAPGKELHFFDRFGYRPFGPDEIEAYHRRLPRPPGKVTGEWTPRYMHDPWTPALLRRAAPDAKIIVLLRDPLDRLRSGFGHEARIAGARRPRRHRRAIMQLILNDAVNRSLYSRQLERVLDSFDRSDVLVLQYERCARRPEQELRRTYEFLGLDPNHVPAAMQARIGRSHAETQLPSHLFPALAGTLARDAEALTRLVPDLELDLWPSVAGRRPASAESRPALRAELSRARRTRRAREARRAP